MSPLLAGFFEELSMRIYAEATPEFFARWERRCDGCQNTFPACVCSGTCPCWEVHAADTLGVNEQTPGQMALSDTGLVSALLALAVTATTTVAVFMAGVATGTTVVDTIPVPGPTVTATVPGPVRTIEVTRTPRATRSQVARPQRTDTQRPASSTPTGDKATYQAYARNLVPASQWVCLRDLWQRESSWRPTAVNGSHYGIPQLKGMKHSTGWQRQITRGLEYIDHRYGTPCAAWNHFTAKGWY